MVYPAVLVKKLEDNSYLAIIPSNEQIIVRPYEAKYSHHYFLYNLAVHTKFDGLNEKTINKTFLTYWNYSDGDKVLVFKNNIIGVLCYRHSNNQKLDVIVEKFKQKFKNIIDKQHFVVYMFNSLWLVIYPSNDDLNFDKLEIIIPDGDNFENPKIQIEIDGNDKKVYLKMENMIIESNNIKLGSNNANESFVLGNTFMNYMNNLVQWLLSHTHTDPLSGVTGSPVSPPPTFNSSDYLSNKIKGEQ